MGFLSVLPWNQPSEYHGFCEQSLCWWNPVGKIRGWLHCWWLSIPLLLLVGLKGCQRHVFAIFCGGFPFVIGLPSVIIHFVLGFSRTKKKQHPAIKGYPHNYGNPPYGSDDCICLWHLPMLLPALRAYPRNPSVWKIGVVFLLYDRLHIFLEQGVAKVRLADS